MLRLMNIVRNGNIVSAIVTIVEADPETFEISVDIEKREIIRNTRGKMDSYVSMARNKLIDVALRSGKKLPKETVCVWY